MSASTPIIDWGPEHGPQIAEWGNAALKKPNPVHLYQVMHDGQVRTNEGTLGIHAGQYIAYDPISGHVWPVDAAYVEQHYEFVGADDPGAGEVDLV